MNLATLGEDNVRRFGEYPALAFEGRVLTNVDQQRAANRLAHALVRLGVAPGDRVAVLLPNCPEGLQAYAAIWKAGAVAVPLLFLLAPDEVCRVLGHSGARVLLTAPDLAPRAEGWDGRRVLVSGETAGAPALEELVAAEPDTFPPVSRRARRPGGDPLHRRDHRPAQGRGPLAPEPAGQRPLGGRPL